MVNSHYLIFPNNPASPLQPKSAWQPASPSHELHPKKPRVPVFLQYLIRMRYKGQQDEENKLPEDTGQTAPGHLMWVESPWCKMPCLSRFPYFGDEFASLAKWFIRYLSHSFVTNLKYWRKPLYPMLQVFSVIIQPIFFKLSEKYLIIST